MKNNTTTRTDVINVNINDFENEFKKMYDLLYENNNRIAGYYEAVEAFDEFLKTHKEFVIEFVKFRGDIISSDREAAAFMFALDNLV